MATKPQIAVTISGKGELSPVLDGIRKRMADFDSQTSTLRKNLDDRVSQHASMLQQLPSRYAGAFSRIGSIPGLGAIAGAGTLAGLGQMVTRYTQMGVTLGNTAKMAGTSAQELINLRGAARMVGLSADTADQAMVGLNETISDATFGKNTTAAIAFQHMKIGLGIVDGHARRASELLPRVVREISKIAQVDPRAAKSLMESIGITPDALPLLAMGTERLRKLGDNVQHLDQVTGASEVSSARFTEALGRMGIAGDGLARTITTAVEPALTPMMNELSTWVASKAPQVGEGFRSVGAAVTSIDWKGAREEALVYIRALNWRSAEALECESTSARSTASLANSTRDGRCPASEQISRRFCWATTS